MIKIQLSTFLISENGGSEKATARQKMYSYYYISINFTYYKLTLKTSHAIMYAQ